MVVDPDALKQLRRLNRLDRDRIERAIGRLPVGDTKRLQGNTDLWRLRVGTWRVRFRLSTANRRIDVLSVTPRGSAYKP